MTLDKSYLLFINKIINNITIKITITKTALFCVSIIRTLPECDGLDG